MKELLIHTSHKTAILYGIKSASGQECLSQLLSHQAYRAVIVLAISPVDIKHKKLTAIIIEDHSLAGVRDKIKGNDLFIFQANFFDKETDTDEFVKNNYLIPLRIAIYAKSHHVNQISLLTGSTTSLKSIFLPHKTKEELAKSIESLGFWAFYMYKPHIVMQGKIEDSLTSTVASFFRKKINEATDGALHRLTPPEASVVAALMIQKAQELIEGVHIFTNQDISVYSEQISKTD